MGTFASIVLELDGHYINLLVIQKFTPTDFYVTENGKKFKMIFGQFGQFSHVGSHFAFYTMLYLLALLHNCLGYIQQVYVNRTF